MSDNPWWSTITAAELLALRRQLLEHLRAHYGSLPEADREDIVQYAFVELLRRRESVAGEHGGLLGYMKVVARNAVVDRHRTLRRQEKHLPAVAAGGPNQSGNHVTLPVEPGSAEEMELLLKIFCALDEQERLVIWSYVVEGESVRAIARTLDLNWHRVAAIIDRVLRRLRRELRAG